MIPHKLCATVHSLPSNGPTNPPDSRTQKYKEMEGESVGQIADAFAQRFFLHGPPPKRSYSDLHNTEEVLIHPNVGNIHIKPDVPHLWILVYHHFVAPSNLYRSVTLGPFPFPMIINLPCLLQCHICSFLSSSATPTSSSGNDPNVSVVPMNKGQELRCRASH